MCDVSIYWDENGDVVEGCRQSDGLRVVLVIQPEVCLCLVTFPVRHQVEWCTLHTWLDLHLQKQVSLTWNKSFVHLTKYHCTISISLGLKELQTITCKEKRRQDPGKNTLPVY